MQPELSGVYARGRLFRQLDRARNTPIVWLAAPAGSGKTTLVASYLQVRKVRSLWYQMDAGDRDMASFFYHLALAARSTGEGRRGPLPLLTPEYQGGLSIYSANFFRDLFRRLPVPGIVVLDNYQDVGDGPLHELLATGFAQIPAGINVVVASRELPPGVLARTRASGSMTIIDWSDMKLTESESRAIIKLRQRRSTMSRDSQDQLHRDAQGWVAGIVLLTERAVLPALRDAPADSGSPEVLFDYFASEIFSRLAPGVGEFLLRTAFLPQISIAMAEGLTDQSDGAQILHYLARHNLFTIRRVDGSFEYHPLFRRFLVARAHAFYSSTGIAELKKLSATLLSAGGEIEHAITLLHEAQEWHSALQCVLVHAGALLTQGRMQTVEAWLRGFPQTVLHEQPWALYWLGMCRLAYSPGEAREYFERAFCLFESQDDANPLFMTWSRIIDSFKLERNSVQSMTRWLDAYRTLADGRKAPAPAVMDASVFTYLTGLVHARYDDPELVEYGRRAELLFQSETNDEQLVAQIGALNAYYFMRGNYRQARHVIARLAPLAKAPGTRPLVYLNWGVVTTLHAAATGAYEESLRALNDGLAFAECSGVHLVDGNLLGYGIWGQLCVGNVVAARALLEKMSAVRRSGPIAEAFYWHSVSLVRLHEGSIIDSIDNHQRAIQCVRASGKYIDEVNYLIFRAYLHVQQGDSRSATTQIAEVRSKVPRAHSDSFAYYLAFCEAEIYRLAGNLPQALRSLDEALKLGRGMDAVTPAYCVRSTAARLYALALEHGIEPEYVRSTISKTRLSPPAEPLLEHWPWPVRIYTLGSFSVLKDDAPLTYSGRTQKKPLELLRVLIALGGRNVAIERIAKAFYPYRSRRVAKTAIDTTLHRLRKLLGEKCVVLQGGELSLNPQSCWLDTLALDQLVDSQMTASMRAQAEQLVHLYRGPFLPYEEATWAVLERERRRSQFLRGIARIGEALEAQGDATAALALYQKGIEADPLAELLYQRLVSGYRRLDRLAEALAVDQRWHSTRQALQMQPDKTRLTKIPRTLQ